ncbi:MAG: RsmB/NOP family class I SAM-dependent RNA methyltransferase [Aestuariivirga sp.]|nr:RsmB/NOP family class I SAM-dependent RNA methyltransferase [Aestuariivirga sp.]
MSAAKQEKPGLLARRAAISLLQGVTLDQQPLDQLLETNAEFRLLEGRDRSFAHALVASSLRHGGEIKTVLGKFLTKPLPRSSGMAVDILTIAAAQLLFMEVSPYAAIDLSVNLAKQDKKAQHFSGLINAVLRKVSTDGKAVRENLDGARLNTPDWLWEQWVAAYGEEAARDIAASHLNEAPLDISVKDKPRHWAELLKGELLPTGTIRLRSGDSNLQELPGFSEGQWWVQDAASALPAKLLGDIAGKSVLDLCAAPGGKTAQLASAGAIVTAVDDSVTRMNRMRENLVRLKLQVTALLADVLSLPTDTLYDNVLLDAPCSATGTIRRHPDLVYLKSPQQLAGLVNLQQKMLSHAARLVKPGGRLVYCTCSLSPLEGERQVFNFLRAHEEFGLSAIVPEDLAQQAQFTTPAGLMRCLPSMAVGKSPGLDGFFAARLERR